ncbi:MAG: hypothetical protein NZ821_02935 [Gloeomargarita sp. SKYB31]|nr:hypothetical protein [Gloeomargarita sp. SKYB31]
MTDSKRMIRFQFPVNPERIPQYVNITLANQLNDDVVIDFGFLDPFCLPQPPVSDRAFEPSGVQVQPVARVAMNVRVAEQLYQQLQQVLMERRRRQALSSAKSYSPQPPVHPHRGPTDESQ